MLGVTCEHADFYLQALGEFEGNGVGVCFGAGAADDDFDSVTDCIDEASIARGESDGEQIGFAGFTES
jgi:hypothetical protein